MRWREPAEGEDVEAWAARELKRIEEAPLLRTFPFLGGWAVLFMPLDVFEFAGLARMFFGTMYGFRPEDLITLRARRSIDPAAPERTYWVIAIEPGAYRRWRKRAARRRLKARRAARED